MSDEPLGGAGRTDVLRLPAAITRLVVLGDPHGDLLALDLVLARESAADAQIVSAGDNVGYFDGALSSQLCLALRDRKIPSVYGNHEDWSRSGTLFLAERAPRQLTPEALAWCRALPYRIRIEAEALPGVAISLVHALPDWGYVNEETAAHLADVEGAQLVLCGHSHRPAIYALAPRAREARARKLDPRSAVPVGIALESGERYVVDAGSLARPSGPGRGRPGPMTDRGTYAVVDLAKRRIELRSVDKTPRLRELLRELMGGAGPQ